METNVFVSHRHTQETFELGKEPVQHMVCGGVGGRYKYLFTGARDGTIQVNTVNKYSVYMCEK